MRQGRRRGRGHQRRVSQVSYGGTEVTGDDGTKSTPVGRSGCGKWETGSWVAMSLRS